MADVLEQSEVDALLAAVDGGQVEAGADGPGGTAATTVSDKPVQDYDFKRPERVSKDQLRALEAIHEGFARNLGASLSGFLRTIIEIRVGSIEQLTYSEFIRSLPNPTSFNLLEGDGLDGQLCLEISPLIIYPIIDRLLGGSSSEIFVPQRPLTAIEQRLVNRLTDRALATLTESWSHLVPVKFRLTATESNPQLVQIVPPNEVVVIIVFEIKMGTRTGNMSLCIPFNVIEPLMGRLANQSWLNYRRKESPASQTALVRENIKSAAMEIRAFLAKSTITVNELMNLQPGDVLTTDKAASGEIILQIEGLNKYAGRVGQLRGHRAIKVSRRTDRG
ncbi:MAG: flagellar motor switch protein FliM, partial [Phycisphaerae bacterium]|nr:flagellar motor switch protein FliM [Phycisphaerae bacterium]